MKKFSFKIRGHKYDVEIASQDNKIIELEINGSQYKVELEQEIETTRKTPTLVRKNVNNKKAIKAKDASGSFKVKCPLPGNLIAIMVKDGDKVNAGDKLFVYEAMKMENVLVAEKAGTVSKLTASVGDAVLQDEVVLEITL